MRPRKEVQSSYSNLLPVKQEVLYLLYLLLLVATLCFQAKPQ